MIRVGFAIPLTDDRWLGGINYYRNLINSIYSLADRKIEPVIILGSGANLKLFKDFPPVEIIQTDLLYYGKLKGIFRKTCEIIMRQDIIFERFLIKHKIKVISHSYVWGKMAKIPIIGWIPDFQHMSLPQFFTPKEYKVRDHGYRKTCQISTAVVLSSYSAREDLKQFEPSCFKKSKVLQFVVDPVVTSDEPGIEKLRETYGIHGPYFHLPNQFWAHKNHRVVIEAMKILKGKGHKVLVLATGNSGDYRQPGYFKNLMDFARQCDVLDSFKVLGIVAYPDLIALMRNALSLINPSLFEGWSTTVEEAKSLGKRIILSDIPVHREQAPAGGVYFKPEDPGELSEAMWKMWSSYDSNEDQEMSQRALHELPMRKEVFARKYQDIVIKSLGKS